MRTSKQRLDLLIQRPEKLRAMLEAAVDIALELLQSLDGDPDQDCCQAFDDAGTTSGTIVAAASLASGPMRPSV